MKNEKQIKEYLNKYSYRAEWSEEDNSYIGRSLELPSILAHANSPENAIKEVKTPLAMTLEMMIENGQPLPEPIALHRFKGKILVRTTPELHKEITIQAAESDVSVNQFILTKLAAR